MRKLFLCAIVVFGCMNVSFGQKKLNYERIFVKTYNDEGVVKKFQLKGSKALDFDIPAFIKEHENAERVTIYGTLRSALLTTQIKFDSKQIENPTGEYICKEENTNLTPFLGLWGTSRNQAIKGVDIKSIIPATSAEVAKLTADDDIIAIDGVEINNFGDLKKAVLSKQIGDRVEITLERESNIFTKYAILGSRGTKTVNYKYCDVEPIIQVEDRDNDEIENKALAVFPNPTRSFAHVNFNSESFENVTFSVMDIEGRLIHSESFSNFTGNMELDYNLGNQIAGTYLFTIQQGKALHTKKVQLIK